MAQLGECLYLLTEEAGVLTILVNPLPAAPGPETPSPPTRREIFDKILLVLILAAAAVGLYAGWKLFWFLTDDAFIAFRYVSNGISGYGYTWNPPPFHPVEGYTSFLWVVLLEFIWRTFGVEPPAVVNHLSLGFSYLTLALVALAVMRMKLQTHWERLRPVFLFLVLLGTLTNRTFLAWTSSGMETAMFNFFFTLWMVTALSGGTRGYAWLFGLSASAVLVYLSRPDGLVVVLGTLLLLILSFSAERQRRREIKKWFLCISPLFAVAFHLGWRRSFYGEWLPNTYFAKNVAPWPEAGVRYLASFILEYALWVWLFLVFFLVRLKIRHQSTPRKKPASNKTKKIPIRTRFSQRAPLLMIVSALAIQVGYYTFVMGGDHFEYRVYSHLVPLIFVSFLWTVNALNFKPARAAALFGLFVLLSWPIPWTHWRLTKNLVTREETHILIAPVSEQFPSFMRWYTGWFDHLQLWLIIHHVCMRHQEHKVFYEHHKGGYPSRKEGERIRPGGYPVLATGTVGIPGWVLPHVAILDEAGLNDYVIARSPIRWRERLMAHDRLPPPGYVQSFVPNVFVASPGRMEIKKRERELTADYIIANEAFWKARVKQLKELTI